MAPGPANATLGIRAMRPACCLAIVFLTSLPGWAAEPVFVARTAAGKQLTGPIARLGADWAVEIGSKVRRKIAAGELVELRQVGVDLPPLPSDEHLVLTTGERLPFRSLRLDDEKLFIDHPDVKGEGGKEASVPLSAVVLIWRLGPDRVVVPERWRRQLQAARRPRDRVFLRNGDSIEGTLNAINGDTVEVEAGKKTVKARWGQVAAIALSSELTDRPRPAAGLAARVVLTATERSPGGRLALTAPSLVGGELRGKTSFGAILRVPLERVASLELLGGKVVPLSGVKPSRYEYQPYLDEKWSWSADSNVTGRDLRVGGSSYDRGVGTHARCRLTYSLGGAYRRFEALVGLDDLDGRHGRVRIKVEVDGTAVDLRKNDVLSRATGPRQLAIGLEKAKELTLVVEYAGDGPVQAVVNWVQARLVK
jgi:hypothetical protein